ncbi:MAG TPA: transglutaminaseTgpA domain-containing protein [Acidimicrobiales bacterium]|nr:transglutaminaseTgpA domain-containing protein [Acidimicrobiales bacterium]
MKRRPVVPRPGGVRPVRALPRVLACLTGFAGWEAVAHFGGAGWVQALGDVVGATLVVGLFAPAVACARSRLVVTSMPADTVAGQGCALAVDVSTRVRVQALEPPGPVVCLGPGADVLPVAPVRRGVHTGVLVELASAAPFGLLWWRRRVRVLLPRELVVAPRLGPAMDMAPVEDDRPGDDGRLARAEVGEPRSVRAYRSGDPRRAVHWPATAHSGELAIKEMETPRAEPVVVDVRLPADPDAAERLAERALGSVATLLERGAAVVLGTSEPDGQRIDAVHTVVEAGRRLARAVGDPGVAAGLEVHQGEAELGADRPDDAGSDDEGRQRRSRGSAMERIRRANAPGPPEHSVPLRVACGASVLCGIAAVWSQGEISATAALVSSALLVVGMGLSYRLRQRPMLWAKLLLAFGAMASFGWFFHQLASQQAADVATVEDPLAVLFIAIQVLHSFDVPARRDLAFSLAGSAILMAVAGAQATDMSFAVYVVAWSALAFWALTGMWASAAEMRRAPLRSWGPGLVGTVLLGLGAFLVVPAPQVAGRIDFPLNPGGNLALDSPLGLAGDGANASEPARPGTPAGLSRVGGFTGFAKRLDTALRGTLSNEVVMRVRAQVPSYWVGETFDRWDGQSWITSGAAPRILQSGSPFAVPAVDSAVSSNTSDLQTFYVVQSTPNLVFHADIAASVWFPARSIFVRDDGTIVSPIALGRGAIYTVRSYPNTASPVALASTAGDPAAGLSARDRARYLELPYEYPQAEALALAVTAHATTTYGKVQALIAYMAAHTRYSLDIPPIAANQDAVNTFLFSTHTGFCEQISSALAVMLRTLGIPAREAAGFVPGPYNPITDLYDIQARDAHAWVQVWFQGFGWQSFDPTASVPLANPAPGVTALQEAGHVLGHVPLAPVGGGLVVVAAVSTAVTWRRRRPATWAERVARDMERAGARTGRMRRADETLSEYADRLDVDGQRPASWRSLADVVEAAVYGGRDSPQVQREADALRRALGRRRRPRDAVTGSARSPSGAR